MRWVKRCDGGGIRFSCVLCNDFERIFWKNTFWLFFFYAHVNCRTSFFFSNFQFSTFEILEFYYISPKFVLKNLIFIFKIQARDLCKGSYTTTATIIIVCVSISKPKKIEFEENNEMQPDRRTISSVSGYEEEAVTDPIRG